MLITSFYNAVTWEQFYASYKLIKKTPDICNHKSTPVMNRFILIAACSLVTLSSCQWFHHRIQGSGHVVTDSRDFSNFTGAEVGSTIDLYVKQDSAYSVKVETDDNLQQYIVIDQSGSTLHIRERQNTNLRSTGKIKVYISAPEFKYLDASGASRIIGQNLLTSSSITEIGVSGASNAELELKSPKVTVDVSGASEITLKGETKDLSIEASGASTVRGFGLLSENTDVGLSGASRAEVFGSVKINASASGASDVYYMGAGAVTKDESGASSVRKSD